MQITKERGIKQTDDPQYSVFLEFERMNMNGETEVMKDTSPSKIGLEQRVFTLVLIADDDDAIRTRLRHIVEAQGYEVIEAKMVKSASINI